MNPSGSSAEQQGDPSWPGEQWYHHASIGGGLDNRTYSGGRLDWDWENAMLLSQQHAGGGGGATDDDHEHKLQTTAALMGSAPRTFNGIIPAALATNYPPHSMGMFGPQSIRSLATIDGSSTFPSSLHGALGSNPNFSFLAANGGHGDFRSSTMDQRRHLFGVMSFQEQKGHLLSDIVKRESDLCAGDAPARIGLNLGVRTYFSTEDTLGRLVRRPRMNSPLAQVPLCQAEGCRADLSNAKHYHRRHKVCELHSKAANVIAGGQTQRFCQQCSRFHVLSEFDDGKRSCRKRLADHNRRRRKPQPTNASMGGTNAEPLALVQKEENELSTTSSRSGNQSASAPPETRALLSAISLSPSVTLMNTKRQIPALSGNTEEAMYKYLQGAGQTGTQLSLSSMGAGLGSDNQALCQNANQGFNGIEPSVPWLRPASESRPDINGSVARNLSLQHLMCNKTDQSPRAAGSSSSVQIFSSSFQNLMPINSSKDMSNSDWLIGREQAAQFEVDIPLEGHQVLSLLEAPTSLREVRNEGRAQIAPMEFLQQRSSLSGNDGDDSQAGSGQHSDRQFSELQGLRPFKSSIYDSNHNIL